MYIILFKIYVKYYLNKIHWTSVILIILSLNLFIKSTCRHFYKKMLINIFNFEHYSITAMRK